MRALCLLREDLPYRKQAFVQGMRAAGITVIEYFTDKIGPDDVLVIWNRYGEQDRQAKKYEAKGGKVIVCENGHLGKSWRGQSWIAMALSHNAGAGHWPNGGPQRWDGWNVELEPWKQGGTEYLITEQRGIGEEGIASPPGWAEAMAPVIRSQRPGMGVRIRPHPGTGAKPVHLREDLANVEALITYHSAAANDALLYGCPVFYASPHWIGRRAGRPLSALLDGNGEPLRSDEARLEMFREMAWAMWTIEEIERGDPFRHLLA